MKTLEILKTKKEEIVAQTLSLLPNALRGDKVNRMFFVDQDEEGNVNVDYFVNLGVPVSGDNIFFTIRAGEEIDLDECGVDDYSDLDFYALGWDDKIENAIEDKIEEL